MKKGSLKIRRKEHGRMIALLLKRGADKEQLLKHRSDSQLLSWMYQAYGYRHHRLWRLNAKVGTN